ncbi:MAG: GxxExxY protein [Bacteroidetes bacterium]|nr:GxxExxY protein [Bacteroidota bacterium]
MPLTRENEIAHKAIGFAIEVHRSMGPGLDKEVYRKCLEQEMNMAGMPYQRDIAIPLTYKNTPLNLSFNIDFILDNGIMLILDSGEAIAEHRIHSMVKLLQDKSLKLGLIINFNYTLMKNGIRRVTNHKMLETLNQTGDLNS